MTGEWPSAAQIAEAFVDALRRLLEDDEQLLEADANERSITHRLAVYLEEGFPGWNVDCEYNRSSGPGRCVKRLCYKFNQARIKADDLEAKSVFPDIIVHRRDTSENLLVIEVKKATSRERDEKDLAKLSAFTDSEELGYRIGVFLKIGIGTGATTLQFASSGRVHSGQVECSTTSPEKMEATICRNLEAMGYGQ